MCDADLYKWHPLMQLCACRPVAWHIEYCSPTSVATDTTLRETPTQRISVRDMTFCIISEAWFRNFKWSSGLWSILKFVTICIIWKFVITPSEFFIEVLLWSIFWVWCPPQFQAHVQCGFQFSSKKFSDRGLLCVGCTPPSPPPPPLGQYLCHNKGTVD